MSEHDVVDGFFGGGGGGDDVGDYDYVDEDAVAAPRDEHALASEHAVRGDDERAVSRAENLLDRENEQLENAVFDAQLDNGYDFADDEYGDDYNDEPQPGETDEEMAYRVAGEILQSHLSGEALAEQQRPSAESQLSDMLSASTAQALHQLAEVEQSKAERAAWNDQRAEQQQTEQQAQGYMAAREIAAAAMEHSNVANSDPHWVLDAANSLMIQWGYGDSETLAGLSDWQREQVATAAIQQAAEAARTVTITNQALRKV